MRKWQIQLLVFIAAFALVFPISIAKADTTVNLPDPNLQSAIRQAIKKPTGDIHQSDLVGLRQLDESNRTISNLTGLEYCTSLGVLFLDSNQITDISPLSGLTSLTNLNLGGNQINDISPLSGLTRLEVLSLDNNQITNISPLSGLTSLDALDLDNNQITDISPLSDLTSLRYLLLRNNHISDIGPLVSNHGLAQWDDVDCWANPLSADSINVYIPQLRHRGVLVEYPLPSKGFPTALALAIVFVILLTLLRWCPTVTRQNISKEQRIQESKIHKILSHPAFWILTVTTIFFVIYELYSTIGLKTLLVAIVLAAPLLYFSVKRMLQDLQARREEQERREEEHIELEGKHDELEAERRSYEQQQRAIGLDNNFADLSPYQFEEFVAELFRRMGYTARKTPNTGDFGADVIAQKGGTTILIECKKYSDGNNVTPAEVQRALGAMWKHKADKCVFITTSDFTIRALELEKDAPVELWNKKTLHEQVRKYFIDLNS